MTTLVFPQDAADWGDAFNSALASGEFVNDPNSPRFWPLYELLASETEDEEIVADQFFQKHTLQYVRIPREEKS